MLRALVVEATLLGFRRPHAERSRGNAQQLDAAVIRKGAVLRRGAYDGCAAVAQPALHLGRRVWREAPGQLSQRFGTQALDAQPAAARQSLSRPP
jgi:hypothetical protein